MAKMSPLQIMTEKFGSKDKLVDQLVSMLESDQTKEDLRTALLPVSNAKLLHLHEVASRVKASFGSREKLIEATAAALNRSKDKDYVAKLGDVSTSRLLDMVTEAQKRGKRVAAKAAPAGK